MALGHVKEGGREGGCQGNEQTSVGKRIASTTTSAWSLQVLRGLLRGARDRDETERRLQGSMKKKRSGTRNIPRITLNKFSVVRLFLNHSRYNALFINKAFLIFASALIMPAVPCPRGMPSTLPPERTWRCSGITQSSRIYIRNETSTS